MTSLEIIRIVINLMVVSTSLGIVFALLVQPRRNQTNYLLSAFCLTFGMWMIITLVRNLLENGLSLELRLLFQIQALMMGAMVATFFVFVVNFLKPKGTVAQVITGIIPVFLLTALFFITQAQVFQIDENNRLMLTDTGKILAAISVVYLGLAFWIIISSGHEYASFLRIPSVILLVGYASTFITDLPLNALLITGAAVWISWNILRLQIFNPLDELNAELRTANRDLQQVINDLANNRKEANELERSLQAANQYKSEFVANMSHELRTPLNSIIGYSELLKGRIYGDVNEIQEDRLEKIHRNGQRLLELISDILDLNEIDAGQLRLDIIAFQLPPLIERVVEENRPKADKKDLSLSLEIIPEPPYLFGDERRIHQIINNLVDNAIKFTPSGSIHVKALNVTVTNGNSPEFELPMVGWLRDGDWMIVSVNDTGIGIAPEHQSRIFDEFSQVDGSHTRKYGGTGLGLAISKRLVEMHNGVIWMKSVVDKGSTFFIALPADFQAKVRQMTSGNSKEDRL